MIDKLRILLQKLFSGLLKKLPPPVATLLKRRPFLLPFGLALLCTVPLASLGSDYRLLRWSAFILFVLLLLVPIAAVAVRNARYLWKRLRDGRFVRLLLLNIFFALLLAAAYPPLPLGWAAGVLLVPWLWTLRQTTLRDGLLITFVAGWCFSAAMYFWIYHVAKVGPPVAVLGGLALLLGYLSLFRVVAGWLFVRLDAVRKRWLFPFAWAGLELFRTYGEFSFPWEHLGYTLGVDLRLMQGAAWVGVYGLSVLLIGSNLLLLRAIEAKRWRLALPVLLLPALLWGAGEWSLQSENGSEESLRVAITQPNIPQHEKWERKNFPRWMEEMWGLVESLPLQELDLVVLPETAVPSFARRPVEPGVLGEYHSQYLRFLNRAAESKTDFLVGFLMAEPLAEDVVKGNREWELYNSAFRFPAAANEQVERYDKIRLVPFSERIPWEGIFPMLSYVDLGEGDFTSGSSLPLWGGDAAWSPSICYEIVYPDFIRMQVRRGARLLVNITNDGWFGPTTAPYQHANIARFRAVELGTPMARAANTGVSLFFDGKGRELGSTGIYQPATLVKTVQLRTNTTLYTLIGDWSERVVFVLFIALFVWVLITPDPKTPQARGAIFGKTRLNTDLE